MSLSKGFKNSRLFQPEEILPRPAGGGSSWSGSERAGQPFKESPVGRKRSSTQGFALDKHLTQTPENSRQPQDTVVPAIDASAAAAASRTDEQQEPQEQER